MAKSVPEAVKRKYFAENVIRTKQIFDKLKKAGMINVLGIDPSMAATAVTVISPDNTVSMSTSPSWIRTEAQKQKTYKRIDGTRRYLYSLCTQYNPMFVVIEDYAYTAPGLITMLAEVGGNIRMLFWDHPDIIGCVLVVTPTQLKKYCLGKAKSGEGTKDKIMMSVYKDYEVEPRNNNEADAFVLARIGYDLANCIDELSDKVKSFDGNDTQLREFIKSGYKEMSFNKPKWEVLVALLTTRCGNALLQFRKHDIDE